MTIRTISVTTQDYKGFEITRRETINPGRNKRGVWVEARKIRWSARDAHGALVSTLADRTRLRSVKARIDKIIAAEEAKRVEVDADLNRDTVCIEKSCGRVLALRGKTWYVFPHSEAFVDSKPEASFTTLEAAKAFAEDGEIVHDGYTRSTLHSAFTAVQNPTNWKLRINRKIYRRDLNITKAAIDFYAGGGMEILYSWGDADDDLVLIAAPGYYARIGA